MAVYTIHVEFVRLLRIAISLECPSENHYSFSPRPCQLFSDPLNMPHATISHDPHLMLPKHQIDCQSSAPIYSNCPKRQARNGINYIDAIACTCKDPAVSTGPDAVIVVCYFRKTGLVNRPSDCGEVVYACKERSPETSSKTSG
jgi:hypothetical protein